MDIILTAGGTGPDVRDVTPEATRKVLDRELPGLAEAMRAASSAKTPNAWLSRAVAGIRRETLIVNLPGSKKAAVENLEAILPVIPHCGKDLARRECASGKRCWTHANDSQVILLSVPISLQQKRLSLFQQSYSTLGARRSRRVHGAESRGDSKAHIATQGGDQIVASTTNACVDHLWIERKNFGHGADQG